MSPGLGLRLRPGWPPQAVLAVPQESPPAGDVLPAEQMSCSEYGESVASFWLNIQTDAVCSACVQ